MAQGQEKERIRIIKHLMDTAKIIAKTATNMPGSLSTEQVKYMEKLS